MILRRGSLASAAWSKDHLLISTQLEIPEWLCEGFKARSIGFRGNCVVSEYLFGRDKHEFGQVWRLDGFVRSTLRSIK